MAKSGSFKVSTSNQYVEGELQWNATQNVNGNYSTVNFSLYFYRKNGYDTWGTGSWDVWIAGAHKPSGSKSFHFPKSQAWVLVHSGSVDVSHSADGSRQINIEVDGWTDVHDVYYTISSPWLETIPRASTLSSGISFTAGVENVPIVIDRKSTTFTHKVEMFVQHTYDSNWDFIGSRSGIADSTTFVPTQAEITQIYRTNNGYEVRPCLIRVRTYDSSGTQIGDYKDKIGSVYSIGTGTMSFSATSFNIGSNITGTTNRYFSNFTYDTILTFGSFTKTWTNVGQNPSLGFTAGEIQSLYAQVPIKTSDTATIEMRTYYNGVRTEDGAPQSNKTTTTLKVANSNPTFGTAFTYKDSNTTITAKTLNDQYIVQGKSTLLITIPVAARALAVNGATMVRYEATVNGVTKTANWSNTADVTINMGTVNVASNTTLSLKAVDSRENSTTKTKTVNIVPYNNPVVSATAVRLNNFEAETTITLSGSVAPLNVNGTNRNSVVSAKYKYRASGGSYNTLTSFTVTGFPNYSATNVVLTLSNTQAWDISIEVTDNLGTVTTVVKTVSAGQPIMFIDSVKDSVGVGKFPVGTKTFETDNTVIIDKGGDGAELLRFDTERAWAFFQSGTTTQAALTLKSLTNSKSFKIVNSNAEDVISFFAETGNNIVNVNGRLTAGAKAGFIADGQPSTSDTSTGAIRITGYNNLLQIGTGNTNNDRNAFLQSRHLDSAYATSYGTLQLNPLGGDVTINGKHAVAVEDSGSNSNGSYVRYSDGTQICWLYHLKACNTFTWSTIPLAGSTYYYTGSNTWTFPASFISSPVVHLHGDIPVATVELHNIYNSTTTQATYEHGSYANDCRANVGNIVRSFMAHGRWK